MVFSSIIFTFIFLPIVLFLYYIPHNRFKNEILLVASLVFYAYGEKKMLILMVASIIANYLLALLISQCSDGKKRKLFFLIDIVINLGLLYIFKYLSYTVTIFNTLTGKNTEIPNIALPIGISFYTFQALSYVADVYRRDVVAEKNILNVGLYISFFPQLVAGPIVRYSTIVNQIRKRTETAEKFGLGAKRFICGFCKKIIIANNLAMVTDKFYQDFEIYGIPVSSAWICSLAYSLQIFFDFSGYSDMAIGLGKMFGFDFTENFDYPYISKTVTEFWRRWHISLSRWFRDYVYIPLGGSRVELSRNIANLLIVWLLTGLWHGANLTFVAWGLMYFTVLIFEKYILKPDIRGKLLKILWQIATLLVINFGWVLFRTESFNQSIVFIKSMFGLYNKGFYNDQTIRMIGEYGFFIGIGILFSVPVIPYMRKLLNGVKLYNRISVFLVPLVYTCVFIWAVSFLIMGAHNPFIYYNF